MKLQIVLRTHDGGNVHVDWRERYCNLPKIELVKGCYTSLVNSIKNVKGYEVQLTILDDHSSPELVEYLHSQSTGIDYQLIHLEEKGYNHSAHQQWLICRDSEADLVYSIEDDYLHCPSAIQEMLDSYLIFTNRLRRDDVVIFPFDEPSEYDPPNRTDYIVHGSARHWRTGIFTTNVMLTRPQLFKDHWELFEVLALKYNGDYLNPRTEHYEESNTIWKIWDSNRAIRFNPIPSLALHMQFDQQRDPFIDWQQWWKDYTQ